MSTSDSTNRPASKAKTTSRSKRAPAKPRTRKPHKPRHLTQPVLTDEKAAELTQAALQQLANPQEFGKQVGIGIVQGVQEAEATSNNNNTQEPTMATPININPGQELTAEQAAFCNDAVNRPTSLNKWITVSLAALGTGLLGIFVGSRGKKALRAENAAFRSGTAVPMTGTGS